MNKIFCLYIIIIFFVSKNVITTLSMDGNWFTFLEIVLALLLIISYKNNVLKEYRTIKYVLIFLALFCSYKLFSDRSQGIRAYSLTVLCPPIVLASLPQLKCNQPLWSRFLKIYVNFFAIECFVAIVERTFHHNIFLLDNDLTGNIGGFEAFRSYGFLGHPLQNALVVSIMMSFILVSNIKRKYWLWGLGFISLLCFEARASIVGNLVVFLVHILWKNFNERKFRLVKLVNSMALILAGGIIMLISFNLGLGARLMNQGLVDDKSAQVRLDIWSIFDWYSLTDFMYGLDFERVEFIMETLKLPATETFWIDYLFRFGFIFLCVMIILYYKLCKSLYSGYPKFNILITACTFIVLSSTNNSLSAYWLPLFVFLFSILLFSNQFNSRINTCYK